MQNLPIEDINIDVCSEAHDMPLAIDIEDAAAVLRLARLLTTRQGTRQWLAARFDAFTTVQDGRTPADVLVTSAASQNSKKFVKQLLGVTTAPRFPGQWVSLGQVLLQQGGGEPVVAADFFRTIGVCQAEDETVPQFAVRFFTILKRAFVLLGLVLVSPALHFSFFTMQFDRDFTVAAVAPEFEQEVITAGVTIAPPHIQSRFRLMDSASGAPVITPPSGSELAIAELLQTVRLQGHQIQTLLTQVNELRQPPIDGSPLPRSQVPTPSPATARRSARSGIRLAGTPMTPFVPSPPIPVAPTATYESESDDDSADDQSDASSVSLSAISLGGRSAEGMSLVSRSSFDIRQALSQTLAICDVTKSTFKPISLAQQAQLLKHGGILVLLPSGVGLSITQSSKAKARQAITVAHVLQSSYMPHSIASFPSECAWPRSASELNDVFLPEVQRLLHEFHASATAPEDSAESAFRQDIFPQLLRFCAYVRQLSATHIRPQFHVTQYMLLLQFVVTMLNATCALRRPAILDDANRVFESHWRFRLATQPTAQDLQHAGSILGYRCDVCLSPDSFPECCWKCPPKPASSPQMSAFRSTSDRQEILRVHNAFLADLRAFSKVEKPTVEQAAAFRAQSSKWRAHVYPNDLPKIHQVNKAGTASATSNQRSTIQQVAADQSVITTPDVVGAASRLV